MVGISSSPYRVSVVGVYTQFASAMGQNIGLSRNVCALVTDS